MASIIEIYCDGSSSPKTKGATGWAYVIVKDAKPLHVDFGGAPGGTNNTAEMQAAIEGLTALEKVYDDVVGTGDSIVLVSDSRYTLGMASQRLAAAANLELVEKLRKLFSRLCTETRWVKGHNGDPFNEICDRLAKKGRDAVKKSQQLREGVLE